jgi:hypothetical protein
MNLTANWDGTVDSFIWVKMAKKSTFAKLMEQNKYLKLTFLETKIAIHVQQVSSGDFDVNEIVGFSGK